VPEIHRAAEQGRHDHLTIAPCVVFFNCCCRARAEWNENEMETPHRGRKKAAKGQLEGASYPVRSLRLSEKKGTRVPYCIGSGLLTRRREGRGVGDAKTGFLSSECQCPRPALSVEDNYDRDVRADCSDPRSLPRSRGLGHRTCIIKRW
jgi:hypothetical protein